MSLWRFLGYSLLAFNIKLWSSLLFLLEHPCADNNNIIISATTYIRLHKAAQLGDLKTIEAACEDQVDLNQTDKFLKTPLMVAAANGRAHIAHILLRHDGYVHIPIT